MPERIFAYTPLAQLTAFANDLAQAAVSGSTQELRSNHTGFLKTTGPISQVDLKRRLMEVRWEIYWRGVTGAGPEPALQAACAKLEPRNPYHEKVMRAETILHTPLYMIPPVGVGDYG